MSQSIDTSQFDGFSRRVENILKGNKEARRKLHERLASIANETLDQKTDERLNGDTTKIKGWQEKAVGTKGGYAAVRPRKGELPPNGKGNAYRYGQITNAIENGHRVRPPSPDTKRKRPGRAKMIAVSGRFFYKAANDELGKKAVEEAERFADEILQRMEGG
ncbi:hypothetical protein [Anaeromassilibacillus senegalensis]|uniref:hypothetical protein n=1 Tax=Anaeromassilibacillus senegalensis TaxID=1673717 RepID=UPI00067FDF75|nr:hypothetical protein [Anaeromassilibacillus senegalensis]